jgi:DtxR family Mn-dependent transcriptional regulator
MYLKTIAEMGERRDPVPVTSLAARLGISTAAASEMVRRLQKRKYLHHTPYKGVRLSELGRLQANKVIRRHRLWECFLVDELGIPWERVHEHACRLEHVTEAELMEALAERLGHPQTCPHGNPIPSPEGVLPKMQGTPLTSLSAGDGGVILRILPEGQYEVLCTYLAERDILPGAWVEIEEIAPFDGPISIRMQGASFALGRAIASQILVQPDARPSEGERA